MLYEGKEVWTEETFSYQKVQVGDYVEQAVVDNAMDCLPPACMIAALMKDDGSARVPGAQDIVNAGDRLIIILNRDIARQVADIFM